MKIPGTQAAFSVKEDQGKIYVLLREKLDKTDLFKAGQEVDYVVIKLQLNDSFGRSQRQTLRLTANSTSNGSRNSRVAELIDKTLKRWHIDPQA